MADTRKKTVSGVGYHYSIKGLNMWFAVSSIAMALTFVWMVIYDHTREWKETQREYKQIEVRKAKESIAAAEQDPKYMARMEAAKQAHAEAQARLNEAGAESEKLRGELRKLDGVWYNADQQYRFARAQLDSARYYYDEAGKLHPEHMEKAKKKFEDLVALTETLRVEKDRVEAERQAAQGSLDALTADFDKAEKELKAARLDVERLERRVDKLAPSVTNAILDAPMMNFLQPTLKVEQAVLANVRNDINFMYVPRVDRCMTCHLGINATEGYAEEKQPFRSHPRPNLFLSSTSPHPYESFGCTSCHLGRDRATDFNRAAHTPNAPEQAKEWEEKHHWHPLHHWDFPMLPARYAEAACRKCHIDQVSVPEAPKLNKGILLFERMGCHGCHKVDGLDSLRKVGPDLRKISGKLTSEWTYKWISNPKNFRHHTKMPRLFNLSNTSDEESVKRTQAEIHALAAFLYGKSKSESYPAAPSGSAAEGKKLFESVGCLGCHTLGQEDDPSDWNNRSHGPNLSGIGSKVNSRWLFAWLKDPKKYFPDTVMPNLRLSDGEAADLVAYLLTSRNEAFEREGVPPLDEAMLDKIMFELIEGQMLLQEAKDKVAKATLDEKKKFVGERLLSHYGCFGCHLVSGFETTNRIGAELSDHGRKKMEQFDYSFLDIPRTRWDWFTQKLKDPRSFDDGHVKKPLDKLKMPQFDLTDAEREALVTAILSFTKEEVTAKAKRQLKGEDAWAEKARRVIRNYNCQGCHQMEGRSVADAYGNFELKGSMGGEIAKAAPAMIKDIGMSPPNLISEGAKVQPDWLFHFLQGPTTIRPWLDVRMPTFGFDDAQINALIRYFSALDKQEFPYESFDYVKVDSEKLQAGKGLFTTLQCQKCHAIGSKPALAAAGEGASALAPNMALARTRLKPQWIAKWIESPQHFVPGTKMPQFFFAGQKLYPAYMGGDAGAQTQALRDYVLRLQ